MQVKIRTIFGGQLPAYKTEGASGADCYARLNEKLFLRPHESATIPLGFAVEIPAGYEMQIRPRSGLAVRNKITVITGTIDSDYRGEVNAILFNLSDNTFVINNGDRIAQAVIAPVIKAKWMQVNELSKTERNGNGFGSTGLNENFYEPFKTLEEIKSKALNREVVIDNEFEAVVNNVFYDENGFKKVHFILLDINHKETLNTLDMNLVQAFERVKIDGHRFGREMQF